MTSSSLIIKGLSYLSPHKPPATVEFDLGINSVCGSSDTGKSLIVETIDFLMGAKDPIRDIPERVGYDRVRLVIQINDRYVTLERSLSGGNIKLFQGEHLVRKVEDKPIVLKQKHSAKKDDSLSFFLLSEIGLEKKYVRKNSGGDVQGFSYRNLTKFVIADESDISRKISPIFSGNPTSRTSEYSAFRLLLSGVDDSSLLENESRLSQLQSKQKLNAQIELIDELISTLQEELNAQDFDRNEIEEQISRIVSTSREYQERVALLKQNLNRKIEERAVIYENNSRIKTRLHEINTSLARFDLLNKHYEADLQRLEAVRESGSLFIYLEQHPCPLCGANPQEEHQNNTCDGNIAVVVNAATAEIEKIDILKRDLLDTLSQLQGEFNSLTLEQQNLSAQFSTINQQIEDCTSPLEDAQSGFSEILRTISEAESIRAKFIRIEEYRAKKLSIEEEANNTVVPPSVQNDFSKSLLDDYCQIVQKILEAWNFPGAKNLYFDEKTKDIIINGQPRISRGQGLRAITYAAMLIGLLEFCKERDLPHPGIVVLDSPLLAYYEPEGSNDSSGNSLEGTNLDINFYNYLIEHHQDNQIIIVDNPPPPDSVVPLINLTKFTRNPGEGRYGLFPSITS